MRPIRPRFERSLRLAFGDPELPSDEEPAHNVYPIIRYLRVTELTQWPKWVIDAHDRQYVDDLLTANYQDKRIALKPRVDRTRNRPIDEAEIADIRTSNPKFKDLPDAALRKLYRRRS